MGILKALALLVANWFGWKSSAVAQRRATARDKAKAEKAVETHVAAGQDAVMKGDEDEVNRRLAKLGMALVLAATLAGCRTAPPAVIIIPESDRAMRLRTGETFNVPRDGWFLSDARFALLLEKAERWEAHRKEGTP